MPEGTKVHRCVDKVRKTRPYGQAIAICQKATQQNYMTGKRLHTRRRKKKSTKKRRTQRKRKRA